MSTVVASLALFLLFAVSLLFAVHALQDDSLQLVQVQTFFRHGDRTPLDHFPGYTDPIPWDCTDFLSMEVPLDADTVNNAARLLHMKSYLPGINGVSGTCAMGQSTSKGAFQHQQLGSFFRKRYVENLGFLPQTLTPQTMWIRSTDSDRTRQSAEMQLFGLYPPEFRPTSASGEVILEMDTVDPFTEFLHLNADMCPRLGAYINNRTSPDLDPVYEKFFLQTAGILQAVANALNVPITALPSWSSLHDTMVTYLAHGHPLPTGFTSQLQQNITAAAEWVLNHTFNTPDVLQVAIGVVVDQLVQSMLFYAQPQAYQPSPTFTPRPWMVWSGHDSTVAPLAMALGIWDGHWPSYASNIVLELWKSTATAGAFYVQAYYNGAVVMMPGCSTAPCPFDSFVKLANVTRIDWTSWVSVCANTKGFDGERASHEWDRYLRRNHH